MLLEGLVEQKLCVGLGSNAVEIRFSVELKPAFAAFDYELDEDSGFT
jgi:hypothetical protein